MNQERIDELARLTGSRPGSIDDIYEIQKILKAEKLYSGDIDGDAGHKTCGALMKVFSEHPALLNTAAPWLIRSMEEQGFGGQLREMVERNPAVRAQLIESTRELFEKSPRAHTEQQTKLSLLNLYNYSGGIDGIRGSEHIAAERKLNDLPALPTAPQFTIIYPVENQVKPPSTPVRPPEFSKAEQPIIVLNTQQDIPSKQSIERIDDLMSRSKRLTNEFERKANATAAKAPGAIVPTAEEQRLLMAEFLLTRRYRDNLAVMGLVARETKNGDYNMAHGGVKGNFTSMSYDSIGEWQRQRINQIKKSNEDRPADEKRDVSAAVGYNQLMHLKHPEIKKDLGLTGKELFSESLQKDIGVALLVKRNYPRWLLSNGSEQAQSRAMGELANEWAIFPKDTGGVSAHQGVGTNEAKVTVKETLAALKEDRADFQKYMQDPQVLASLRMRREQEIRLADASAEIRVKNNVEDLLKPSPLTGMSEEFANVRGKPVPVLKPEGDVPGFDPTKRGPAI